MYLLFKFVLFKILLHTYCLFKAFEWTCNILFAAMCCWQRTISRRTYGLLAVPYRRYLLVRIILASLGPGVGSESGMPCGGSPGSSRLKQIIFRFVWWVAYWALKRLTLLSDALCKHIFNKFFRVVVAFHKTCKITIKFFFFLSDVFNISLCWRLSRFGMCDTFALQLTQALFTIYKFFDLCTHVVRVRNFLLIGFFFFKKGLFFLI
jgi:hypothetical protein